jgi:hypothetical protein
VGSPDPARLASELAAALRGQGTGQPPSCLDPVLPREAAERLVPSDPVEDVSTQRRKCRRSLAQISDTGAIGGSNSPRSGGCRWIAPKGLRGHVGMYAARGTLPPPTEKILCLFEGAWCAQTDTRFRDSPWDGWSDHSGWRTLRSPAGTRLEAPPCDFEGDEGELPLIPAALSMSGRPVTAVRDSLAAGSPDVGDDAHRCAGAAAMARS